MGLPGDSEFWRSYHRSQSDSLTAVDRLREREAYYNRGGGA